VLTFRKDKYCVICSSATCSGVEDEGDNESEDVSCWLVTSFRWTYP
jgi:hypothetical protein